MAGHTGHRTALEQGVRERKKQLMREQLSNTATRLFLERGFDAVKVSDVAAACGVSEKTVFNYFPSKEALVLDRLESSVEAIRDGLADPGHEPVTACVRILEQEIRSLTAAFATGDIQAAGRLWRFGDLLRSTPSLSAYQSSMMDRFADAAAAALAARVGLHPHDPEPQLAAHALLSLWRVQGDSLHRHLVEDCSPQRLSDAVIADVHRAARLLDHGLGPWNSPQQAMS